MCWAMCCYSRCWYRTTTWYHWRIMAWCNLIRSMWLDHLLRIQTIWSRSRNDRLHMLHLSSTHSIGLWMRSIDCLGGIHDSISSNSLQLLLNVLLLRCSKSSIGCLPHVHTLPIALLNVHLVTLMNCHTLIGLLIPARVCLSLFRHLLHLSILRLPLCL